MKNTQLAFARSILLAAAALGLIYSLSSCASWDGDPMERKIVYDGWPWSNKDN